MATLHQRRQSIWKRTDRRVVADQRQLAERIGLMLMREATATNKAGDRTIPPSRTVAASLSKRIWNLVLKPYYIGSGNDPLDGIKAQSPFADIIVDGIREAITFEAKQQVALTRKLLRTKAPDVLAFLVEGIDIPGEEVRFQLIAGSSFDTSDFRDIDGKIDPAKAKKAFVRPRGTYDPFHRFVDPAGYRLSDRIWRSGLGERTAIDRFLEYHIPRGTAAVTMADELEQYLTGSAAAVKTAKPYGTSGSYSARRLARTEITAAAGRSTIAMSEANPFVGGVKWNLSLSHPEVDQCDKNARGGPNRDGIYPPTEVPRYPDHPHELCTLSPQSTTNIDDVVQDIRKKLIAHKKNIFYTAAEGTGTKADIQNFKKLLDPEKLATAAMTGTLDQTLADVTGTVIKSTLEKKTAAIKLLEKEAKAKEAAEKKAEAAAARKAAAEKAKQEAEAEAKAKALKAAADLANKIAAQEAAEKALKEADKIAANVKKIDNAPKLLEKIGKWEGKIFQLEEDIEFFKKRGNTKKVASLRASRSRFRRLIKEADAELPEGFKRTPLEAPIAALVEEPEDIGTSAAASGKTHLKNGFPNDLDRLEDVRGLGGSTGAKLVRDPVDGKLYVKKQGNDAGHIAEELATDLAYQAMGVNVPEANLYATGARPTKLARFVEGRSLQDLRRNDAAAYRKAKVAIQNDFASDALLGNWDVIGQDFDNIIVENNGKVWRIDNGGGLRRRAQGDLKKDLTVKYGGVEEKFVWNKYVDDIWSMRNQSINAQTFEIFGDIDYFDIEKQTRKLAKAKKAIIAAMPDDDMRKLMAERIEILEDLADISKTFRTDDWIGEYTDEFSRHSIGLRKRGIIDKLPKKLDQRGVEVRDENGKTWDDLRVDRYSNRAGQTSIIFDMQEYMEKNEADYGFVTFWADQQKGDSWMNGPQGVKYFFAQQRTADPDDKFWWKTGDSSNARSLYENNLQTLGARKYNQTFTQLHAFNYEFMRNVDFKRNNQKKGLVRLMRTEDIDVMRLQNFTKGETGQMKRGVAESCSIFEEVYVHGTELTVQQVPHHRILGNYFLERSPGLGEGMFLGDGENEFVAMLDGLDVKYQKSRRF